MATLVPEQTRVILRVNEVETTTQIAHCEDKTGGVFKAQFGDNYGVLLVPEPGELWNATRVGYIWKLVSRIDITVGLQPGDGVIDLSGALKIFATSASVNGKPIGSITEVLGTANRISVLNGSGFDFYGDGSYGSGSFGATGSTTVDIDAAYVGQASITTLGTITTGIWNASTITASKIDAAIARLASPTFTGAPAAPTAAVDTNTTQIATTAFVLGQVGTATPLIDGAAAVGTSLRYSRQDHIHPTDTTRAALASPTFTGTPAAPTAAVDTNTTQVATTAFVIGQGYLKQGDWWFGDGSDGDVTISTTVTMTRDMHYHNLTLTTGASLIPNGFRIFVSGTLDLTAAPVKAIAQVGTDFTAAPSGTNEHTSGSSSGTAVTSTDCWTTQALASQSGGSGSTTTTGRAGNNTISTYIISQISGGGGGGGGGSGTLSGTQGVNTLVATLNIRQPRLTPQPNQNIPSLQPPGTGGAGGGDTVNFGGAGGGIGGSGGTMWIAARTISRGGGTAQGCINASSGASGRGGNCSTGNCGGGGGGGGPSGGYIHLIYLTLTGSTATKALIADGSAGGTGGTGVGTGGNGGGGTGGSGGIIDKYDLSAAILTKTLGTTGGAHSGTTGGTAGTCQVDL